MRSPSSSGQFELLIWVSSLHAISLALFGHCSNHKRRLSDNDRADHIANLTESCHKQIVLLSAPSLVPDDRKHFVIGAATLQVQADVFTNLRNQFLRCTVFPPTLDLDQMVQRREARKSVVEGKGVVARVYV